MFKRKRTSSGRSLNKVAPKKASAASGRKLPVAVETLIEKIDRVISAKKGKS